MPSWLSGSWRCFLYSSSVYSCHFFLISSASVRSNTVSVLSCAYLWMKCSLGISHFLEEVSIFPILLFSSISLHWSLRKAFFLFKTIPKKKKCKKAKWLSEEALQIAEQRREAKGKGEKERYIHLNAEFQRIARRDKKAFLSDQCKEIEKNNRMGKTRDLFKKIRDTKGTWAQ